MYFLVLNNSVHPGSDFNSFHRNFRPTSRMKVQNESQYSQDGLNT